MMKKIDLEKAMTVRGTLYPAPFDTPCRKRVRTKLGDAAGLDQFGVNLCRLPPGAWSSQRHWHTEEDELVFVVEGEVILVTDAGEETLKAGDSAGFKANDSDGHHFQNRTQRDAVLLEVGTRRSGDIAYYPDIDLEARGAAYLHRDGTPYPDKPRAS
jgi:uncharacterized cupin superfamily protein